MKSKMNIKSIVIIAAVGIVSLFFINMSLAASTGKVVVDTANLRETPNEDSTILELLSMNQEVEIIEKVENWYKVKTQGITGYLREDLLTLNENIEQNNNTNSNNSTTTQTVENSQTQNIQEAENNVTTSVQENTSETGLRYVIENTKLKIVPIINATDIIEVKKDEQVNVIEEINGWVCVEIGATKGWIRQEKLQKPEEKQATENAQTPQAQQQPAIQSQTVNKTLYIKSASVNMRKESNTSSEVVTTLTLNTAVTVTEELSNGWSKVQVNGNNGYILSSLLSTQKQETSRSQSTPRQAKTQTTTASNSNTTKTQTTTTTKTTIVPSGKGATVIATAQKYLGCKYVYGGTTPNGFDCSGFTSYVFKLHGINLSRTSQSQYKNGVAVSKSNLQPGDLVFFYKGITHVGIYIGSGNFIHAANKNQGVIISTLSSGHYCSNYAGARRVM